jgi:hypothetical protein
LDQSLEKKGAVSFRQDVLCQFRDCQTHDLPVVREVETLFCKRATPEEDVEIYRTNVFENGLIAAWVDLCRTLCAPYGFTPPQVAKCMVAGLSELCFNAGKKVFDPKRDYVQNVIFRGKDIIVNSTSKRETGNLIIGTLLSENSMVAMVTCLIRMSRKASPRVRGTVESLCRTAVGDYIATFEQSTRKHITRNYHFTGLDEETVRYLDERKGLADPAKSREFERRIEELAMSSRDKAVRVLANVLDVKVAFLFADEANQNQI